MTSFAGRASKPLLAFLLFLVCLGSVVPLQAQDKPLWLRYPAIAPDGQSILFCYKGDIYRVSPSGGQAIPLTISESYDFSPVWSHDGKFIAFASNRYGNFDIFIMPASGGEATRLTYHSADDIPSSFTADDQRVLFTSWHQDLVTNVQFPVFPGLYSVSVKGGEGVLVLPQSAISATVNPAGDKIIYHDLKGYENDWRKHHTSSATRDIWVYDLKTKKSTQLTTYKGEDRNPVFDQNGDDYYYLSEQNGSFNVYHSSLSRPAESTAVTAFNKNPVRFLTSSKTGVLCFGYDGEVYTMAASASARRVDIRIAQDGRQVLQQNVPVQGGITEMRLSPNGKEIAYVFRGEIFVSNVGGGVTKRITNTPWQERSVSFSPDGRTLVYAAEKNNNWNIYTTSIARKEEPYFYASTVLKDDTLVATPAEEFQPQFSPDGKEVAYLENRVVLKVINLASKQTRTVLPAECNYSYADGDQNYRWSPDGKWFLVKYGYVRLFTPQVGLISSDGKGKVINLTKSGFSNRDARWGMDGTMMYYRCTREGAADLAGSPVTTDVYGMFFTRDAYDRFRLSKADYDLLKEQEDKAKEEKDKAEKEKAKDTKAKDAEVKKEEPKKDVVIEFEGLENRKARFTINSANLADMALTKTGDKLFYLAKFEKGYDLWVTELRTKDTKLFAKLGAPDASMEISADGKALFVLAEGKVTKIDPESAKMDPVAIGGEMVLDQSAEKAYIFDHMWRQIKQKFLVADLYGADWDFYYTTYHKFLAYINNNDDYAEMVSEMLGELNASHTGCYYFRQPTQSFDDTASLGLFMDYDYPGPGLKVAEILSGGPLDKAALKIRAGHIIEKIDGRALEGSVDHYQLLNRKTGQLTLLSVYDQATQKRWEEAVKPIPPGEEGELLYRRWVKARRAEVDRLSGGRVGYVHVQGMDDSSFRTVIEEVLGLSIDKEALIVDTRFNGGGNLHDKLSDFLSGKKVFDILPRGQLVGYEPYDKWIKPSIVLMGEGNYSDAHLFPVEYKIRGIGKTLGMPVPGTGTFVWWENQIDPSLIFGIPQGGWKTPDGKLCENNQLEPDILVKNDPDVMAVGRDQQIEAAVKELLKK